MAQTGDNIKIISRSLSSTGTSDWISYANSVEHDQTAPKEQSDHDPHCLSALQSFDDPLT